MCNVRQPRQQASASASRTSITRSGPAGAVLHESCSVPNILDPNAFPDCLDLASVELLHALQPDRPWPHARPAACMPASPGATKSSPALSVATPRSAAASATRPSCDSPNLYRNMHRSSQRPQSARPVRSAVRRGSSLRHHTAIGIERSADSANSANGSGVACYGSVESHSRTAPSRTWPGLDGGSGRGAVGGKSVRWLDQVAQQVAADAEALLLTASSCVSAASPSPAGDAPFPFHGPLDSPTYLAPPQPSPRHSPAPAPATPDTQPPASSTAHSSLLSQLRAQPRTPYRTLPETLSLEDSVPALVLQLQLSQHAQHARTGQHRPALAPPLEPLREESQPDVTISRSVSAAALDALAAGLATGAAPDEPHPNCSAPLPCTACPVPGGQQGWLEALAQVNAASQDGMRQALLRGHTRKQVLQLCLSPPMLSALERSQPVSAVYTFEREEVAEEQQAEQHPQWQQQPRPRPWGDIARASAGQRGLAGNGRSNRSLRLAGHSPPPVASGQLDERDKDAGWDDACAFWLGEAAEADAEEAAEEADDRSIAWHAAMAAAGGGSGRDGGGARCGGKGNGSSCAPCDPSDRLTRASSSGPARSPAGSPMGHSHRHQAVAGASFRPPSGVHSSQFWHPSHDGKAAHAWRGAEHSCSASCASEACSDPRVGSGNVPAGNPESSDEDDDASDDLAASVPGEGDEDDVNSDIVSLFSRAAFAAKSLADRQVQGSVGGSSGGSPSSASALRNMSGSLSRGSEQLTQRCGSGSGSGHWSAPSRHQLSRLGTGGQAATHGSGEAARSAHAPAADWRAWPASAPSGKQAAPSLLARVVRLLGACARPTVAEGVTAGGGSGMGLGAGARERMRSSRV